MKHAIMIAAIFFVFLSGPGRCQAPLGVDLIVNGSFELGPSALGVNTLSAGSTELPGWTITGASIDFCRAYWQNADGQVSIDLDGFNPGAIEQTIPTTPGAAYAVVFNLAANPGSPFVKWVLIEAGIQSTTRSFNCLGLSPFNMGWTQHLWIFQAMATTTTVRFTSLTPGTAGPAVDTVSVYEVVPPGFAGQANSAVARLEVNGYGVGTVAGPFSVPALQTPSTITFNWSGPPGAPFVLYAGPPHPGSGYFGCFGIADIGTGPLYSDITPVLDGTSSSFPGLLFHLDGTGNAQQTYSVPALPPGLYLGLQGLVLQPSSCGFVLTAAFYVTAF